MIAVVDNGASKCEWIIGNGAGEPINTVHPGYNPNSGSFHQEKEFIQNIKNKIPVSPDKIFFYSAGMGNHSAKEKMRSILKTRFLNAEIIIETDLTGTGRAVFGDRQGLAAILGTGANAGFYNGENISHQPLSLGFLLGDEGSGAYFGKILLQHYLRGDLQEDIMKLLEHKKISPRQELLNAFYSHPSPKVFTDILRAFEPFKDHRFVKNLIQDGFELFFDRIVNRVKQQKENTIGFTGSVAHYFKKELERAASAKGYHVYKIVQHPAKALYSYHLQFQE